MFQSTHSRGVRLPYIPGLVSVIPVSIHALTRSATKDTGLEKANIGSFNPRTHEECDRLEVVLLGLLPGFNPRTHEECDR